MKGAENSSCHKVYSNVPITCTLKEKHEKEESAYMKHLLMGFIFL